MGKSEVLCCAFCREILGPGETFVSEMDERQWLEQIEIDSPDTDLEFMRQEYGPLRVCRKCRDSIAVNEEEIKEQDEQGS